MPTYTIKQGDTLSGIAQQYGMNANDLAKSNNIADPNVIQAGANLTVPDSSVSSPKVPNTFNAADLNTPSNFDVPPATPSAPVDPFVASLDASQKSFQNAYDAANKDVQPIQQERDTLTTRLQSALDNLKGKGSSLVAEETKLGVPENIKQLNDLNLQIAQKKGEFDKAAMNAENQQIPVGLIQGQQATIRRQQAVELGALASVAQALQGNIALAQQTAQRTVDLEFSDKEQEVKNLQTLLSVNTDNLTTAEKKSAAQLSYILDQRQKEIDQAKEERKGVLNLAAQAAQYGADNTTLSKMSQAKTPEEAIAIGGNFLGKEYKDKLVQQAFTNSIELQKLSIEKIKALKTSGGNGSMTVSPLSQSVIENPALFFNFSPTAKAQVVAELQNNGYDTSNLGVKGLSDTAIKEISQSQEALKSLQDLRQKIQDNKQYIGPIKGLSALNPWSDARKVQADVNAARQRVGKALEGGVLRKEDEDKYKKILATLNDTPETAEYKIMSLIGSVQRDIENYTSLQQSSGKSLNVNTALFKKGSTSQTDLRGKYNY